MDCPQCSARIPAEHVNVSALVAKCEACGHVFSFDAGDLGGRPPEAAVEEPPRPPKIVVRREESPILREGYREGAAPPPKSVALYRRWMNPSVWFLLFFCIAWDGFLVFWYGAAFASGEVFSLMTLFPILHVAVGVGLTYHVLTTFVNRSEVTLDAERLKVWHGPLPWKGNFEAPRGALGKVVSGVSHKQNGQPKNKVSIAVDGVSRKVMGGLSPEEADYVAWVLNDALG